MSISAPETKLVQSWRVPCDGGEGALGHPRVWLELDRETGEAVCGYCGAKYVYQAKAAE